MYFFDVAEKPPPAIISMFIVEENLINDGKKEGENF
jgi:hypothetical protein